MPLADVRGINGSQVTLLFGRIVENELVVNHINDDCFVAVYLAFE